MPFLFQCLISIALLIGTILLFFYQQALKNFKIKLKSSLQNLSEIESALASAKAKAEELSKYQDIIDVELHISVMKTEADLEIKNSSIAAKKIVKSAEIEAQKIRENCEKIIEHATLYEKTAIAMKNIIEGYGDQYLIPTNAILDQLGDDYSHTKAGEHLKAARDKTRSMIKNKLAAKCDYAEENRKQTAIEFVVDAFNGKVDTILSSVKSDNFGTLEQKIKDSFQTVNFNGKAFRDAKILEPFLSARVDELRWACAVHAIKQKEKEEQRRIREQIREEEKAVKEFEKVMRETEKEEETLAKAMEKIKDDMLSASEVQRVAYDIKLKDLEQKLKTAEEKNQRALSMAQQTRTGHVYIISNVGSFGDDILKIGMTRRLDPMDRIDELGDASVPFDFDVHAMISSKDAPALEKELHNKFSKNQVNKVNQRKEFFKVKISEIKAAIDFMKIETQWTLLAEAREFRETKALTDKKKAA